jgi:hypothetical protein
MSSPPEPESKAGTSNPSQINENVMSEEGESSGSDTAYDPLIAFGLNCISGTLLWALLLKLCSFPINIVRGLPISYVGDPPILEMFPATVTTLLVMMECDRRFQLSTLRTAVTFMLATLASLVAATLFLKIIDG